MVATRPQQRDSHQETLIENKASTPPAWVRLLGDEWTKAYGGIPPYGQLGKRLKALVDTEGFEPVRERWQRYLDATEGQYASPTRFAQTYGAWDRPGGAPAKEEWVSPDAARVAFRKAGIPDSWAVNPDGYSSVANLNIAIAARCDKLAGAIS